MKKSFLYNSLIIFICISFFACKTKEQLPPAINSVAEAQKIMLGKTWQVIDVATVTGSRKSVFDKADANNTPIVAPKIESLNWFSEIKGIDTATDFMGAFYKENFIKFKKITIALNKDSIATTTGFDSEKQVFNINNTIVENEPKGIKLTLNGDSKAFADMGMSKMTTTYYILGGNEKALYLLTPNEINNLKVVFLLSAK